MGVPTAYRIGTPFARKGVSWAAGYHTGEDYLTPTGTPIQAMIPGKVVHVGWGGWGAAYGIHVIVEVTSGSLKGRRVLYAHLSSTAVRLGQTVNYQQVLGKSGATGNVTGPHLHLEVRVAPYAYRNHANPESVRNWKPAVVPKAFQYPKRPALGGRWAKISSQNCSYDNSHGVRTHKYRFDGLIDILTENHVDLLGTQELPAKYRNQVDRALKRHGMVRMAGNYGRYTYGDKKTVRKIKGKSVTPSTKGKGGKKKPYTLLNCKVNGVEMLHVNLHLQAGAGYAANRRKYLREVIPEVVEYARKSCGLPKHRIIWVGDFNGHKEIVEEFAKFGFYASYKMAHKRIGAGYKSTNQKETKRGWTPTDAEGYPIDLVFTTASRPTSVYNNRRHQYADHSNIRTIVNYAK